LAALLVSTPIAPAVVFVAAAIALSVFFAVLPSAILDLLLLTLVTPLVILRILVFVVIIPVVIIPVVTFTTTTSSPSASVQPAEWLASPSERLPAR